MKIGLQKLTLLDYPGVMACTVFTCKCNFRCPFCHNAALVNGKESDMPCSTAELLEFLKGRKNILEGVCITGGEPLLHPETLDLIREIKAVGYKVKLDTNGSFPQTLEEILDRNMVDYVAMDIKHSPEKYALASGSSNAIEKVKESVKLLLSGTTDFEFRTTVVRGMHTASDIEDIARWISGAPRYFLQNYTDSGDILADDGTFAAVEKEELDEMLKRAKAFIPAAALRG